MNAFVRYKAIFSILFFLCIQIVVAQESAIPVCGTETTPETMEFIRKLQPQIKKYEKQYYDIVASPGRSANIINSVPIKAHIIRASDGSGGLTISELDDAMNTLNAFYANAFLEFFICDGINYIDDDNFYDFETSDESALTSANNVSGLVNIYFTDYIENTSSGGSLCGYAYGPGGPDVILMANDCTINGSTLPHEIGHFFSLIHTHGPSNVLLTDELVDGTNCDTTGDLICDTPADPQLSSSNVDLSCTYSGTKTDANGHAFTPDTNNIMSYSRKSCRTHFSAQQYARMYATYHAVRNYFACPSLSVDFVADVTNDCDSSLSVNFSDSSTGATSWQWDIDSDGTVDYTSQNPSHTFGTGIYDVTLTISNGSQTITRTINEYIKVGVQESIPINVTFEGFSNSNENGWSSVDASGNGYHWLTNSGETPSNNTGPAADNTTGNASGTYVYAEATGPNIGDEAYLISPCFEVTYLNTVLEFAYHMHGLNIGQLHVDIQTDSGYDLNVTSVLDGQKQSNMNDPYLTRQINLSAYTGQTIKVRFRAVRGGNFNADIAIDDVTVNGSLLSLSEQDKGDIMIYPNPVSGDILHVETTRLLEPRYEIANILGQKLQSGILEDNQVDVRELSAGTYFLILRTGDSKIIKRFVRQ